MGRLKEANNEKPRPVLRQSMVFSVEDLVARLVSQSFEAADDVVEGRFVKSQQTHCIFKQSYSTKMMPNVRQTIVHDFATDFVLSAQLEASMAEALTRKATMVHINRLHLCQISISDVVIERLGRKVEPPTRDRETRDFPASHHQLRTRLKLDTVAANREKGTVAC